MLGAGETNDRKKWMVRPAGSALWWSRGVSLLDAREDVVHFELPRSICGYRAASSRFFALEFRFSILARKYCSGLISGRAVAWSSAIAWKGWSPGCMSQTSFLHSFQSSRLRSGLDSSEQVRPADVGSAAGARSDAFLLACPHACASCAHPDV